MNYIAPISLALSILAIIPAHFAIQGFFIVFISQVAGGIAFAKGRKKLATASAIISLINISCLSLLSINITDNISNSALAIFILMSPFILGVLCFYLFRLISK